MSDIPGLPARRAALKLLDAVLRRGETIEQASHNACQGIVGGPDRALAIALASEALRWLTDLDALIDSTTNQTLDEDTKVRSVLRLMIAGWLRLETPPHAVIATGLPLLTGGPRRLAHGVFSSLSKRGAALPDVPSLPAEVAERWGMRADAIAKGLGSPPPLDLTLRDPATTAEWAEKLGGVSLMPGHVRLPRGDAIENLEGFNDGAWWVQDLAASLPARLLGAGEGRRVLDLCAAPGGKTLQLAAAGWQVTALDISAKRLERVEANCTRVGLEAELVTSDALEWQPEALFDAVLMDAPCTATGTARRHPDVLHRIAPRHIAEMAELQKKLIARAIEWVRPGGALVYAVCSLEADEGEGQAHEVQLDPWPITADALPAGIEASADGWLRTDPGMLEEQGGMDGFFIARWRKPS
ncbi:RsmB/NOP family class I SAM-dependent RNA methyltransferase [Novosphingobium sp.]|uniref:RsmB/NOP family class I SAM-dependent RNA methyltransferase n=1 Tax=Novosphingobium sp. TaxID=1874826 RepID=UPI00286D6E4A|nr:RsmB/NOP family class I SAM-dependent RNA methyltransferase [Novosphingobium sp.]